jgi:hypothetical protein
MCGRVSLLIPLEPLRSQTEIEEREQGDMYKVFELQERHPVDLKAGSNKSLAFYYEVVPILVLFTQWTGRIGTYFYVEKVLSQ